MDTVVTASGISKVLRFLQLAKSYCLISFMPFGSLIFVRDVQPTNSPFICLLDTLSGIITSFSFEHEPNVPRVFSVLGSVRCLNFSQ